MPLFDGRDSMRVRFIPFLEKTPRMSWSSPALSSRGSAMTLPLAGFGPV